MDGNPPPDPRGTAGQRSPGPLEAREANPDERLGPLALRRMTKDDGRSLIVYERVDRSPHHAPGTAHERRGSRA